MIEMRVDARLQLGNFLLALNQRFALDGITALFGPNGSGKTTLLRIIAGLESRAEGCITYGEDVWQSSAQRLFVAPHRRGVGFVFQDARLFTHLTVSRNLHYAERRSGAEAGRIPFADVVDALDLAALLDQHPASLSGGERQRVAMGRTLLTRPRLLLMDEPLAALDMKRKAEILPYIERLASAFQIPVIYVTHAVEEVAQLADRMVVLANGMVAAQGDVSQILERLDLQAMTGRFEAGVVLKAQVVGHDARFALTRLDHHGQSILMPILDLPCGSEVRLRIRARDVALATRRPEGLSIRNVLSGIVRELVEEPDTAFAEVLVGLGGTHLRARVTRQAVAELGLRPGAPVFALIKSVSFDRRAFPRAAPSGRAGAVGVSAGPPSGSRSRRRSPA